MPIRGQLHTTVQPLVDAVADELATVDLKHRRHVADGVVDSSTEIQTALVRHHGRKPQVHALQRQMIAAAIVEEANARHPHPKPASPIDLDPQHAAMVGAFVETMRQSGCMGARSFRDGAFSEFYDEVLHRALAATGSQIEASRIAGAACKLARTMLLNARDRNDEQEATPKGRRDH